MARTSPELEVKEIYKHDDESQAARAMFAIDAADLIRGMIEQGKLEIKNGQIMPKGN